MAAKLVGYSKAQRKALHCTFVEAKKLLWAGGKADFTGKFKYICYCLTNAHKEHSTAWWVSQEARNIIMKRMGNCCYLEAWLVLNGHAKHGTIYGGSTKTSIKMQATRLAWLNSLIEEFST